MCVGRFTGESENKVEIALGCENGIVYILRDFAIHKWVSIGHTITQLHSLNAHDDALNSHNNNNGITQNQNNGNFDGMDGIRGSQSPSQSLSLLICAGHFNAIKIYSKTTVCPILILSLNV